jgi:hypothetical protein
MPVPQRRWRHESILDERVGLVESRYFDVRNNSDASDAQVRGVVRTLETDCEAIA